MTRKANLVWVYTNEVQIVIQENLHLRSASNGCYILERSGYFIEAKSGLVWKTTTKFGRISSYSSMEAAEKAKEKLLRKIQKETNK